MYGQMKRYKESLKRTPEPVMISQLPQITIDLKGLMSYAKETGRKVAELSDFEKNKFIKK